MIINVKLLSVLSTTPQWLFFNRQSTDDAKYGIASFAQIENHLDRTLSQIFHRLELRFSFDLSDGWSIRRRGRIEGGEDGPCRVHSLPVISCKHQWRRVTDEESILSISCRVNRVSIYYLRLLSMPTLSGWWVGTRGIPLRNWFICRWFLEAISIECEFPIETSSVSALSPFHTSFQLH